MAACGSPVAARDVIAFREATVLSVSARISRPGTFGLRGANHAPDPGLRDIADTLPWPNRERSLGDYYHAAAGQLLAGQEFLYQLAGLLRHGFGLLGRAAGRCPASAASSATRTAGAGEPPAVASRTAASDGYRRGDGPAPGSLPGPTAVSITWVSG